MPSPQGQSFGKYLLLDRIAAGGMAEIFRARYQAAAGVTKQVVIKKILQHYAGNRNFVQMFINEAKIVVGLSHGNIAQVFDFGEIDGEYFLAMEYVHGQPLSKVLRREREMGIPAMPTPFAVFIALEMCRGLHYAHTRLDDGGRPLNIVHRDVSPQNVILSYEGQVKLVDFGIAKARTAGRDQTEAGALKGKYVYFAPEQARAKELDARTDVFAVGIVLYEMLCGRLPFEGKMIEVLGNIVKGNFTRPREMNPDLDPALERIILTAMANDKAERFQTAQQMGEALAQYLYANAPTFSSDQLSKLLGFLYEKELVSEGLPVQLPRDFLEQVPLWKKPLPNAGLPPVTNSDETAASRPRRRSRDEQETRAVANSDDPTPVAKDPRRTEALSRENLQAKPNWGLFIGLPLGAALIAAVVVFAVGRNGSFSVQLTSNPPGATVTVDGVAAPKTTPLTINDLSIADDHRISVVAPGHKEWLREVRGGRGETLALDATLESERPPDAPKPLTPPVEKTPDDQANPALSGVEPQKTFIDSDFSYPVNFVDVRAKDHAFDVAPTKAARIRLDPSKTYRVWTEGKLSLGGLLDNIFFDQVFFYVEGNVPPKDSYGMVGPKGVTVKNATALYAWVFDVKSGDNSGAIKLRVQPKGGQASTLLVDAREHYVDPDLVGRLRVTGLTDVESYEVVVTEGSPPAMLGAGKNAKIDKILYVQNSGVSVVRGEKLANGDQRVLELGKKYTMQGASWMIFTLPDSNPKDNSGTVRVQITPIAGSKTNSALGTFKKAIGIGNNP